MHCRPRHTPSTGTPRSPKCADRARSTGRRRPGGPGPGEISTASGASASHLVERDRVVAVHDRLGAELTEVLHEVVDERVVVVDHEHAGHGAILPHADAAARRLSSARAPVEEQAVPLHAAAAEEGAAQPSCGSASRSRRCLAGRAGRGGDQLPGLLPGDAENRYLHHRLVLISGGFMMATGLSLT